MKISHSLRAGGRLWFLARLGLLLVGAVMFGVLPRVAITGHAAGTFTVTSTADAGPGTLRQAIIDTNGGGGGTIVFNIAGTGPFVIAVASPLPAVQQPVYIDGITQQPGASCGDSSGAGRTILIQLQPAAPPLAGVNGLQFWTNAAGSTVRGLAIGGFGTAGTGNWGAALYLSNGIKVECSNIGTDASGTAVLRNQAGVAAFGANNTIGGSTASERNIISGNATGVLIAGGSATGNRVQGNYIGTNAAGTGALPNNGGVQMANGASNNTVGGTTAGERNVISGNSWVGVSVADAGSHNNFVKGNYIGTNAAGTGAIPNGGPGVQIQGAPDNTIGGSTAGERNVISGNNNPGVILLGSSATHNLVLGNNIGTDATGLVALPNNLGIQVQGAQDNTIASNVVSGNRYHGVFLVPDPGPWSWPAGTTPPFSAPDSNEILHNLIGVAGDGSSPLPNSMGVTINSGNNNKITDNTIAYNDAGTSMGWGVDIYAQNNSISVPVGNTISQNRIYENKGTSPNPAWGGGLGILGNEPYGPAITRLTPPDGSGSVTVDLYWRRATPGHTATFEVFASPVCDPSGWGEGKRYLGTVPASAPADSTGYVQASGTFANVAAGELITATATRDDGTTSQFSICVTSSVTVTSISPIVAGAADTTVTINGTGFTADSWPVMQGITGSPVPLLDAVPNPAGTQITAKIPAAQLHSSWSTALVVGRYSGNVFTGPVVVLANSAVVRFTIAAEQTTGAPLTVQTGGAEGQLATLSATTSAGAGSVGVATYPSNPASTHPGFQTTNGYFDIFVSPTSSFGQVTVEYCDPGGGNMVYWYDRAAGTWKPVPNVTVSPGAVPPTTCLHFVIANDPNTHPNLSELTGTVAATGIDSTPPAAAPVASPAPNAAGWNTSDVTVSWNWTDDASGIDSGNCATSSSSEGDGVQNLTASCRDNAGNVGTANFTARIDKIRPTIAAVATQADSTPYVSGTWTNQSVTVHFNCTDGGSGIASCPADQVFSADGVSASVAGTATDLAGNVSDPSGTFTAKIDKTAPVIAITSPAQANAAYPAGTALAFAAADTGGSGVVTVVGALLNTTTNTASNVSSGFAVAPAGVYRLTVTVTDAAGNTATSSLVFVVYDPEAGFVIGGGWINSPAGAYTANPALAGKAVFAFVSAYKKGAPVPSGATEFLFHAAGLKFKGNGCDWLVIAGAKAQCGGTGTVNGVKGYRFLLSAIDGKAAGGHGTDRFRIKIWNGTGTVYDSQVGGDTSDSADPALAIGGGSIVIHR